jgi:phosphonopyruvate decarboxylase
MGHSAQIALGIALARPEKVVYCLDGDGALIMHMGGLAIIGSLSPANFRHILLNNGSHDSVGGHPSAGFKISTTAIAKSCGYKAVFRADTVSQLCQALDTLRLVDGPALLEVRIAPGARKALGRPTGTPKENKQCFMTFLNYTMKGGVG